MTVAVWLIQVCVYLIFSGLTHFAGHSSGLDGVLGLLQSAMAYSGVLDIEPEVCAQMLLTSVAVAAWFHLCYALAGDGKRGQGLLLELNSIMVLCAGIVIPKAYMPEILKRVSTWIPVTFLHRTEASMLFDSLTGMQVLLVLGWTLIVGALATWIASFERRGE